MLYNIQHGVEGILDDITCGDLNLLNNVLYKVRDVLHTILKGSLDILADIHSMGSAAVMHAAFYRCEMN